MTTAVQRRRGTNTEHATFTGLDGEITVNTTTYTLHVHDGATVGGIVLAKADGSNIVTSSIDINGGTIDGTVIGGSSAAAGSFTTISASGQIVANGGIALGDNDAATFGASNDLQIYHDGGNSYISDFNTGDLVIQSNGTRIGLASASPFEWMLEANTNGSVTAYYDGSVKLSTTSTGIDVTGTLVSDGLTVDGNAGIGTNDFTDSYKTIIEGSDQETGNLTDSGTHGATLFLRATGESVGSGGAVAFGTTFGNKRPFAAIKGYITDGTANSIGHLVFSTRATVSDTALSERLRITDAGNVGIGTTNPSVKLQTTVANASTEAIRITNSADAVRTHMLPAEFQAHNSDLTLNAVDGFATIFKTTNTERMRIDASGNLLVGKTAIGSTTDGFEARASGYVAMSDTSAAALNVNRNTTDGALAYFYKDGTTVGSIGFGAGTLGIGQGSGNLGFFNATVVPMGNTSGGASDGVINLGAAGRRFKDIYATNGTIQTSDQNEKQDIEALSEAEQRVAVACKSLLRKFRWKSAVEEKGEDARIHFGIIAQDLQAAFEAEGLDAGRYGMFINSTWIDEETGEERSRMGVRYSELLAFIIAAI